MADTIHHAQPTLEMLRQCRAVLGGMEHGLSSLMKGRERDFLGLGENLMALQSGCEDISRHAQELVEQTAGEDMHAALGRLSGELTTLTDVSINDAGRRSLADIENVGRIVEELSGITSAFSKIVKHLSMLGIATRIESARLGADGRGFSTLADDVEKLAHLIVDHCGAIAAKVETLRGHVQAARERTRGIIKAQEHCYDVISRELTANIESVAEMAGRSAEVSRQLSLTAGEIETDIGQAVRSLQSHDIVRQQIEHAERALAEVAGVLETDPKHDDAGEDARDLLAFVADVLTLQDSQLKSADRHFSEAAGVLRESLSSLASRIRGFGGDIAGVTGVDSPLTRVQAGIAAVKAELGDFAAQGEALGGIMDSVAATITGMGGSIEAIEEVGAEIELIALNASIKAAHTGEAGAALGVLALAIQHLSADARRQTDAVAAILGDISNAAETLRDNAGKHNDQSEAWRVVGELDAVLADVVATAQKCRSLFAYLRDASDTLGTRAAEVGRGIDFDREIGSRLAAIRRTLNDQLGKARKIVPEGGRGTSARLRELYDRYTMEAERAVHETAFGLAPTGNKDAPGTPAPEAATAGAGGFGDNVELF
ncbi:methyl-accepting chemotaxis protein [Solidesulfovibrio fructosivorans]|nr:methyl-accepting chemotaxis protein [Solidesulfovibrio fructosivorans]